MPAFGNPDGSFLGEVGGLPVTVVTAPSSGAVQTMQWNQRDLYFSLTATLAAQTVLLPKTVKNGDYVCIGGNHIITALTIHDGFGNAITGAPTALAIGAAIEMRYLNSTVGWVLWK